MTSHNTIMGIGLGLFLIILVWVLALFLCIAFSRATGALSNVGIALILVAILFSIILLVLPREDFSQPSTKIYDYSVIYRSLLIAGCALFLVIGLVAYLVTHAMEPVYAKTLRRIKLS
ncbi:transmembrane protein 218-like [Mya arenaria]|uniref:transmembrane protein 218-like n=1 Tax=Mya arenaria TaxID=6604 RepID=UPI0022E40B6C|nr:transmembrane protein 218-like [Mya arenaria]XP_052795901.1 transmembrane protein 218-like [Mya arenaria]